MRRTAVISALALLGLVCSGSVSAAAEKAKRNFPYVELEGTAEDFSFKREWRSYYWREDFTFVLRDAAGKRHRVISREPTPWNNLRLGTTYTGLAVDWTRKPRVQVIGVRAVDRQPAEFYGMKLDPATATAFIVRVADEAGGRRDYYVNNWFHDWSAETDKRMLAHYAVNDPNYTVYGFLGGIAAPFDAAGKKLLEANPDWGGVIYHGRVVKADNEAGYEVQLIHLLGRNKKNSMYAAFHGDAATLVKLDGRKPRFVNVTDRSGLSIAENTGVGGTNPHAVAVTDFDGDGRPDILITTFGAPYVRYFHNRGAMKFEDVTKGSGLEAFAGAGTGAAVADFDADGKPDVYLTSLRNGASRLFRNKGDGTFTDVSEAAGVLLKTPGRSCAWSDVDGDGRPDLYVTCPKGPNQLFRNQGDGTFTDIAKHAGVDLPAGESLGCAFADIDGDGLDDLFVTNYHSQVSALFKSLGGGKFRNITVEAGVDHKSSAVGCTFGDVFNRGVMDLYVSTDSWLSGANSTEEQLRKQGHTVEPDVLYVNDGKGKFTAAKDAVFNSKTLGHDAILEDLDHDGLIDIYVGVDAESGNKWATTKGGNPLWTRPDGKTWKQASAEWGLDYEANCVCTAAADFDGDGDLDLLLVNFYSNVVLYRNETNGRGWLQVKPVGTKSNRDGIGAKVSVFTPDGKLAGFREVQSGAGYCRCSPLEAHVGLGASPAAGYRVEVVFPGTKAKVVRENVKPGQRIVIKESE